jgi:epoxyqueuosine reductase
MQLDEQVRRLVQDLGTDFYGVADLSRACDFVLNQGGPAAASYPRVISAGIVLQHAIVDLFPGERRGRWRLNTNTMPMMF